MASCCGKERNSNFCPECGKAMDHSSSLRGLLRYLTQHYERYTKKVEEEMKRREGHSRGTSQYAFEECKRLDRLIKANGKKAQQYKSWQEAVIKAIDGE